MSLLVTKKTVKGSIVRQVDTTTAQLDIMPQKLFEFLRGVWCYAGVKVKIIIKVNFFCLPSW